MIIIFQPLQGHIIVISLGSTEIVLTTHFEKRIGTNGQTTTLLVKSQLQAAATIDLLYTNTFSSDVLGQMPTRLYPV